MTLDIATLLLAAMALDVGIALYAWALWLSCRSVRIHLWVAASATSATIGCLLYMLRQAAPDWVAIWLAQVCFIQTFAFLWAAIRLVHHRSHRLSVVWAASAVWSAACLVPPLFAAEQLRNVVATLGFTTYCLAMSVEMLRPEQARPAMNRVLAAALLWLLSGASLTLAVDSALQRDIVVPLNQAQTRAALWLMLYLVIYTVLILAVVTLELGNEAERQRRVATLDGLTGLLNRRAFFDLAGRLTAPHREMAVLMLDIDHFKRINDLEGHAAGDAALVRFATLLRRATAGEPTGDGRGPVLARFGGEEFVCLIPGGNEADGTRLGETMRRTVETDPSTPERPAMTVSIGFAAGPIRARTLDALLQAADAALYRAKHAGRNRVAGETFGGEPASSDGPRIRCA
ncbi:hypothetical protein ASF49_09980 [Methylobacterium sp. Leaf104]|uniref:GGDEF domain-containing protein n=1 Tax=Methylobacterium TaxID=407 RepID=UPI0006FA685A|nr:MULTISPECIES: GGDEF domain-containing protein [Methylobacterium]KQP31753.1 hypothetical protein ASF49_09980 [Methylobacterium sp. Leaf104]MCI9880671.1 GGDEF domain-containing protein [Methylobacterium goesingense]